MISSKIAVFFQKTGIFFCFLAFIDSFPTFCTPFGLVHSNTNKNVVFKITRNYDQSLTLFNRDYFS